MADDSFLTKEELFEITEYQRPKQQCSALSMMGIPFIITRSGRPLVYRKSFEEFAGCKASRKKPTVNIQALKGLCNGP